MTEKDYLRMDKAARATTEWQTKTAAITVALICWTLTLLSLLQAVHPTHF